MGMLAPNQEDTKGREGPDLPKFTLWGIPPWVYTTHWWILRGFPLGADKMKPEGMPSTKLK